LLSQGNMHQLADRLGVKIGVVRYCIQQRARYLARPEIVAMIRGQHDGLSSQRRPRGKPGNLTDAQRAVVLSWYAAYIQSGFQRGSMKWLALDLKICPDTLYVCIHRKGLYKKPYREPKSTAAPRCRKAPKPSRDRKLSHRDRQTRLITSAMRT